MRKRLSEIRSLLLAGKFDAEIGLAKEVMTAEELSRLLGIPLATMMGNRWHYKIPCQRLGRRLLFSRDAIRGWLSRESQEHGSGLAIQTLPA